MWKVYVCSILAILAFMLTAGPVAAQAPTETPLPAPTMRYFSRSELMAGIGIKPYTLLNINPEFDIGTKFVGTFPEGISWFKTFLYLASENGALTWIGAFFVMFFVTGFLLAIFNLRNGKGAKYNIEESIRELQTTRNYTPGGYLRGGGGRSRTSSVKDAQRIIKDAQDRR